MSATEPLGHMLKPGARKSIQEYFLLYIHELSVILRGIVYYIVGIRFLKLFYLIPTSYRYICVGCDTMFQQHKLIKLGKWAFCFLISSLYLEPISLFSYSSYGTEYISVRYSHPTVLRKSRSVLPDFALLLINQPVSLLFCQSSQL